MPGVSACPLRARVDPRLMRFSAVATASILAFGAAALNVATGLCLGCKAYLLIRRPLSA